MSVFFTALRERNPDPTGRRWLYVPYDQLSDGIGLLSREDPESLGIVLVESAAKAGRRPYHKRKLALVLANQRQFALEQAARGVAVRFVSGQAPYADALRPLIDELGPLAVQQPAERELRMELAALIDAGGLRVLAHEGWLTTEADFDGLGQPPWRMDAFYRRVRQRTGILMVDGKPEGGRYSFDGENRKRWPGTPPAPARPRFEVDPITAEVLELIDDRFADHPGTIEPDTLPTTAADAEALWAWALTECMPLFGPYEDAMAADESGLFHTRVSELLNLHRLLPARVVADVAGSRHSLPSREGFVRQVLGWREFVRHVHRRTDGFEATDDNHLDSERELPPVFWGDAPSGLHCLDSVVADVWREGYSHHITRLMVLSNLATLLDIEPRQLSDWFWVAYADAYDWVVEPNVLAMGTFGAGPVMTTKPYVSGANYLAKMSDYCDRCRFHPKKSCPITPMYWAFLARKADRLQPLQRMKLPLASMRKRAEDKRAADQATFEHVSTTLQAGGTLTPG